MRGQVSTVFLMIGGAFFVFLLIVLFIASKSNLEDMGCRSELQSFRTELQKLSSAQAASTGSLNRQSFNVPCGVDQIFFFDDTERLLFSGFEEYPLMLDALNSNPRHNTFLIKEGEMIDMMYIDRLDVKVPYFMCLQTNHGFLDILIQSNNGMATLWPQYESAECTFDYVLPIEVNVEDTIHLLGEIFRADQDQLNKEVVDPLAVNLSRSIRITEAGTVITIGKTNGTFDYYEQIPKCAISALYDEGDLTDELDYLGRGPDRVLHEDPLIMWEFEEDGEEEVSYRINKHILYKCLREGLIGVGLSDTSYPGSVTSVPLENRRQEAGAHLKEGLKPAQLPKSMDIAKEVAEEVLPLFDEIATKIRLDKEIDINLKLSLLKNLQAAQRFYENSPLSTKDLIEKVILDLPLDKQDYVPDEMLEKIQYGIDLQTAVLEEMAVAQGISAACEEADNGCRDIFGFHKNACVSAGEIKKAVCSGDYCTFRYPSCAAGEQCIQGMCVSEDAACVDSDAPAYLSYPISAYDILAEGTASVADVCIEGGVKYPDCMTDPKWEENCRPGHWNYETKTREGVPLCQSAGAGEYWHGYLDDHTYYVGEGHENGRPDDFMLHDIIVKRSFDNIGNLCFEMPANGQSPHAAELSISYGAYFTAIVEKNGGRVCIPLSEGDRGLDEAGAVSVGSVTYTDTCTADGKVLEYFCGGSGKQSFTHICAAGSSCVEGVCVEDDACQVIETDGVRTCYEKGVPKFTQSCTEGVESVYMEPVTCRASSCVQFSADPWWVGYREDPDRCTCGMDGKVTCGVPHPGGYFIMSDFPDFEEVFINSIHHE